MRISDWSSDVCSSDLPAFSLASRIFKRKRRPGMKPRPPPRKIRVVTIRSEPIAERPLHRPRFAIGARAEDRAARIILLVEQVHRIQLQRPVPVVQGGQDRKSAVKGKGGAERVDFG